MARRTNIRTGGMVTWVSNIKNEISEELAKQIVRDLKTEGPYWTGQFEEAWRVKKGNVDIAATEAPFLSYEERMEYGPVPFPGPSNVFIPPAKGRATQTYSIGNITTYRDIAMDLEPDARGIFRKDKSGRTADPDWYLNYMQNTIYGVIQRVTNRVASQSSIKNYKGKL